MIHPIKKINSMNGVKREGARRRKIMARLPFRLKVLFIFRREITSFARGNARNVEGRIIWLSNVSDSRRLIIYQHIIHILIGNHLSVIKILAIDRKNHNLLVASYIKTRMNRIFSKGWSKWKSHYLALGKAVITLA